MAETIHRGKIRKPIAPEIVQYISAPIAEADFQTSYDTMLDVNRAHVLMLVKQGIIDRASAKTILQATERLAAERIAPDFVANPKIEDLYTSLEQRLIADVGLEVGGRQHTARSRNDLGATVIRLDTRAYYLKIAALFIAFRKTLLKAARDGVDAVMSGYTHMQPSEPITFGHWASGVLSGLARDYSRFSHAWEGLNVNPLGACSMGSTSFPIDRAYTSRLLGFDAPLQNSIDSVATRDYAADIVSSLAITADTLSRMAFDLYIWSTPEYGYVEVDDSCAVCSSIMPQKKNPFTLEHIKAKAGHMHGYLMAILSTMKNIIYSHSKDTSVEATKHLMLALKEMECDFVLADVTVRGIKLHRDRMLENARENFCTVTELANYLVRYDGIAFREAHNIVAGVVGMLCDEKKTCGAINRAAVNAVSTKLFGFETKLTDELIRQALDPARIAEAKNITGGTARDEVSRQLDAIEQGIRADEALLAERMEKVNAGAALLKETETALLSS